MDVEVIVSHGVRLLYKIGVLCMLFQLIRSNLETVLLAIIALQGLLLLILLWALVRMGNITGRFKVLLKGSENTNLENLLVKSLELGEQNQATLRKILDSQSELRTTLARCVQNKAVVRFNAYDDISSDLSFAVALLDGNGDGVVISSLYGRDDSRTYAKPVVQAKSKYPLNQEEIKAINDALQLRR